MVASRRFQVERDESMEKVVGQEGEEQETFDGVGVMAKDVIGMPLLGKLFGKRNSRYPNAGGRK